MKTVVLEVRSLEDTLAQVGQSWTLAKPEKSARISFATPELLWKVLTQKRWALLRAMAGQDAMSLRAAARLVSRDVKSVHGDVHALLDAGIIRRLDSGAILFPYNAVHVDFVLNAA